MRLGVFTLFVGMLVLGMCTGCRTGSASRANHFQRVEHIPVASVKSPPPCRKISVESPQVQVDCKPCECSPSSDTWKPVREGAENFERFLSLLKKDARGVANANNVAILGLALGGAIGMRQDWDAKVRENTLQHPNRWGKGSEYIGKMGEPHYQLAAIAALYGYSHYTNDQQSHELADRLISTFALTGLSTLAVKGIANTDRPSADWNRGQFGFPSYHAASSFAAAAVIDEYYGPRAGLPAYALAGLIGWSRIDERDHDLSDVFFGAALGYVIGKSVAGRHLREDSRVRILPFIHPTENASGLMFDISF